MRSRRNGSQLLVILEVIVLIVVVLFGVMQMKKPQERTSKSNSNSQMGDSEMTGGEVKSNFASEETESDSMEDLDAAEDMESGGPTTALPPVTFSGEVQAKLATMTIEEKVAQLFLTTPEALTHNDSVEVAGEGTRDAINTFPVGGLIYSSRNFQDKEQTRNLLLGVQQFSNERIGLPMFLGVEEAGGADHSPLASANGYDLQISPAEAGASGNPIDAAMASTAIASYLAEEGFNLNLAPCADLVGGADSLYDGKCYGIDASTVSMMVAESVNGYHTNGLLTATGMFPGKGAGSTYSKKLAEWKDNDALSYQAAINARTDFIVVGNVVYEPLTGDGETICSLSGQVVSYLRNDMGYTGILMTDSLSENMVSERYSLGEAAVEAVKAGVNVVYCPMDFETAYQAVLDEVNNGGIPQDTVEQAAGYILTQKMEMSGSAHE